MAEADCLVAVIVLVVSLLTDLAEYDMLRLTVRRSFLTPPGTPVRYSKQYSDRADSRGRQERNCVPAAVRYTPVQRLSEVRSGSKARHDVQRLGLVMAWFGAQLHGRYFAFALVQPLDKAAEHHDRHDVSNAQTFERQVAELDIALVDEHWQMHRMYQSCRQPGDLLAADPVRVVLFDGLLSGHL